MTGNTDPSPITSGEDAPKQHPVVDVNVPPRERPTLVIEVGWVIAGRLDAVDLQAVRRARDTARAFWEMSFPNFLWRTPLVHRDELAPSLREEPVALLDHGVVERDIKRWDFTILVTGADLISNYRPTAIAVISRVLEGAVISTCRIDPRATRRRATDEDRIACMTKRIRTLAIHALGHLAGLDHVSDRENLMFDFDAVEDLDHAEHLTDQQRVRFAAEMRDTGDQRLEEAADFRQTPRLLFHARAIWRNRNEIVDAIIEAKPWQFPFRLSRLTTAAASAMVALLVTAEAWDLGMSQSRGSVATLSFGAVAATTAYILFRQRLLMRRAGRTLTEQSVVTNVSTIAIVITGMLATYALVFVTTLAISWTLFNETLITAWAESVKQAGRVEHHLLLSGFIASLGIFIGALGASFEQYYYFRHITFVDEEI